MAIAEQFAGLQMDQLIGAPLRAAADASVQLATAAADFINSVGFDAEGKVRTVAFGYQKRSVNEDGTSNLDEMKVDVPMLAIVPIPNLQVDEVNILFDMEVKQSERQESSMDMGASLTGSAKIGPVKVSVTGSISSHQSNTRSSDNSAKYHVDVRATNHGVPEGLARVLDMMAANVAPTLVGSTLKDGDGRDLSGQAKAKAERLKALRAEISQLENRLSAAKDGLTNQVQQLKRLGDAQLKAYRSTLLNEMNALEEDDENASVYSQYMDELNTCWADFQSQVAENIQLVANDPETADGKVSALFNLKALIVTKDEQSTKSKLSVDKYTGGGQYNGIAGAQKNAVTAQNTVNDIQDKLVQKKAEYNNALSENVPTA